MRNKEFILNLVVFIFVWGNYITIGNVLTPLFGEYFSTAQISVIGMIFVITGAVSCFLMGVFLDRTKKFLTAIRAVVISIFCLFAVSPFILPLGLLWLTCIFGFFAGLFNVPILPACYQYAATQTGKLPPAVVNGLMMSGAQSWAFTLSLLVTLLMNINVVYGLICMTLLMMIALICAMCIKEKSLLNLVSNKSVLTNEDSDSVASEEVEVVAESVERTTNSLFAPV
uniref:MFS transporter n=1 Tax=Favella ehrenbergii TaxID=182087 RepID=A0A7S3I496_9SPIT|mmetsp:Transcript_34219/g.42305  ORF Transcript_34219/g.42305 Transcript_34219/m.42305 type:complete len:227 (+) Transcript_34219:312-992(+)